MLLYGKEIAESIYKKAQKGAKELIAQGITPTLALLRIGDSPDDIAYQKAICSAAKKAKVEVRPYEMPIDTTYGCLSLSLKAIMDSPDVHGVMLFRPLPPQLRESEVRSLLNPKKDIDGITDASMASIYAIAPGKDMHVGFPPCTAEAAVRVARVSSPDGLSGKTVAVVGRSLVVGRPTAMLLLAENATVSVAHTKTADLKSVTRSADIVIVCAGLAAKKRADRLGAEYFSGITSGGAPQLVVDCGINADKDGLYGDVDTEAVLALGADITPVPGGLGAVTTAVLMEHTVRAARFIL